LLGLNGPIAPRNRLGAAVWALVREVAWRHGYFPMVGIPTGTRDAVTGVVAGSTAVTVPAGLPLTYTVTVDPTHGKVSVDETGAYVYTPTDVPVTDAFRVTVSDGLAAVSALVSLPVVTTTEMPKPYNLSGVAISPDGTRLYVTNAADAANGQGTVVVLDAATKAVIASVDAGIFPQAVALSSDGKYLYVANWNQYPNTFPVGVNGGLSVIDTITNTVTSTVEVRHGPKSVAVSPDGTRVYVANEYDNTVSVIDAATSTVTSTIPVGSWPWAIAVSPDGSSSYVADSNAVVAVIDAATSTVTGTIAVGPRPRSSGGIWGGFSSWDIALTVSPDGSALYVLNRNGGGNELWVVDTATKVAVGKVVLSSSPTGRQSRRPPDLHQQLRVRGRAHGL
jgi:YVTN family beta-propeller protein